MSDTHLCSGCNTTFTLRGYQSHLFQTKNPLCRAVYDRLKKSYETYQLLEQGANPSDEAIENDNTLDINMEGDSDHSAALENMNQNFEEVPVLDEEELDDSELEDIDETGWEPPRDGAPQEDALAGEDEPADTGIRSEMDTSSLDEEIPDSDNAAAQCNFDRYIIGMDMELNQLSNCYIRTNIYHHKLESPYLMKILETIFTVHHLVVETTPGLLFIQRRTGKLHDGQRFEVLDQQHFLTCSPLMG